MVPAGVHASLAAYLAQWEPRFDWSHNCAHFAAGWVRWHTGLDALVGLQHLRTLHEWRDQVGTGIAETVSQRLRVLPVLATLAQAGDVVLVQTLRGTALTGGALGICAGRTAMVLDDAGAVHHVPMTEASCAWPLRKVHA